MPTMEWRRGKFKIEIFDKEKERVVSGWISVDDIWGVRTVRSENGKRLGASLTHIPSGKKITNPLKTYGNFDFIPLAQAAAEKIAPLVDWKSVRGGKKLGRKVREALKKMVI